MKKTVMKKNVMKKTVMKNKKLLDSFVWIENTGKIPDCGFVEVVLGNKKIIKGKPFNFLWTRRTPRFDYEQNPDYDIIKYREISEEECDEK